MTSTLLDLSGKIDSLFVSLCQLLTDVTASIGTRFFVVGATARDLILERGFGIPGKRATRDVDVGVRVPSWDEFSRLKSELLETGQFVETREAHRFLYRGASLVDVLPFGGIGNPNAAISWPPDHDVLMSVVGFEDAYKAAQVVRVRADPPFDILVASLAGLTIMKVVAWAERPSERNRDARDLMHILERYLDAGNYERLVDEHQDLVNVQNFDYVRAGARLLGRDIAKIASAETKSRVLAIVETETAEGSRCRLVQEMMIGPTATDTESSDRFGETLNLLRELEAGISKG